MKLILDTNIWISFLIGHKLQAIRNLLTDVRYEVFVCSQLTNEIVDVARRDKIRRYVLDSDVEDLLKIMRAFCHSVDINTVAKSEIRDPKDLYLLSLAETVNADYIISGDTDLTIIGRHKNTRIITLTDFNNFN